MIPEETKVNLGVAGLSRHVAIWLQRGVLKVVVKAGAQGRHLGVHTEGPNHLHSLAAGHGILLWGLKFSGLHVHVNYNQSKVLI